MKARTLAPLGRPERPGDRAVFGGPAVLWVGPDEIPPLEIHSLGGRNVPLEMPVLVYRLMCDRGPGFNWWHYERNR
jgi:hypothetical protein